MRVVAGLFVINNTTDAPQTKPALRRPATPRPSNEAKATLKTGRWGSMPMAFSAAAAEIIE